MPIPRLYQITFDTRFGPMGFVHEADPFLLRRVYLPRLDLTALAEAMTAEWGLLREEFHTDDSAQRIRSSILGYFAGKALILPWDRMAREGLTALQWRTLEIVADIPAGEVRSYGEIARQIGRPKAARFVGSVMASNPFPLLIPCHRVVRQDRTVGGFGGGPELKKRLLDFEGADYSSK